MSDVVFGSILLCSRRISPIYRPAAPTIRDVTVSYTPFSYWRDRAERALDCCN